MIAVKALERNRSVVNVVDLSVATPVAVKRCVQTAFDLQEPVILRVGAFVDQDMDKIVSWSRLLSGKVETNENWNESNFSVKNGELRMILNGGLMLELAKRIVIGENKTMPERRLWIKAAKHEGDVWFKGPLVTGFGPYKNSYRPKNQTIPAI
jgi:hypothetical protein